MTLRGTCLKLFQLLAIPLFSTDCPRSITFPNNTTRPDNQSTKYQVSGLLFLGCVWDIEEIPFYKVAKGSCEEARGYLLLWTTWRWEARPKTPCVVGVHTQVETIHIPFSSLVSLEEPDCIYDCYHWDSRRLWLASAILLEIRAKFHTCKDKVTPPQNIATEGLAKHCLWLLWWRRINWRQVRIPSFNLNFLLFPSGLGIVPKSKVEDGETKQCHMLRPLSSEPSSVQAVAEKSGSRATQGSKDLPEACINSVVKTRQSWAPSQESGRQEYRFARLDMTAYSK